MRLAYAIFLAAGLTAIVANHLTSPSTDRGRPLSPEDYAGACAPCGAPCPSAKKPAS